MKQKINIFISSAFSNNSTFVLLLGLCSILATSSTLSSAVGMGLAVMIVLMMTNLIISLLRKIIPAEIRIPVYIIIIASTVTVVDMLMKAFTDDYIGRLFTAYRRQLHHHGPRRSVRQ